MTAIKKTLQHLEIDLEQFGLNPKDWEIHFSPSTDFQKIAHTITMKNVKIANKEDKDFYFYATITLETHTSHITAHWQEMALMNFN